MPKRTEPSTAPPTKSGSSSGQRTDDKENRNIKDGPSADVEQLTRKIRRLETSLKEMEAERDMAVRQYDALYNLKHSKIEMKLDMVKEKAMQKHRMQEDVIKTLKDSVQSSKSAAQTQASVATERNPYARDVTSSELNGIREDAAASTAEVKRLKEEMAKRERDWKIERNSLSDQIRQLERENKAEREASKSMLQKTKGGHHPATNPTSSTGTENADKIRALYEDLTGLTISSIETYDSRQGFHRFRGVFASPGYHHLQLCLEESTSDMPSDSDKNGRRPATTPQKRADLVYIPQIQEDRDSELLQAGTLPSYFTNQLRFDRALGVKFMEKLHKALERK